jgi:hypothetical protein
MAKKKVIPTPEIQEIRELKEEQYKAFYSTKIKEQKADQEFYDDKFSVAIKKPYHIKRTGSAARIIDIACATIDTSNPVVFCEPRKKNEKEIARALKRAKLLNHWIQFFIPEINEAKMNLFLRGESFFQVDYNDAYDKEDNSCLPVIISAPDPMIIYADPQESNGLPARVIKSCNMNVGQVKQLFPTWTNPRKRKLNDKSGVEYLAYWDAGTRYIEADKETLLGPQTNIFNLVPFAHCYSGFGKRSPEGKPETLVVGRLRKIRGRLEEECEIESRLDSIIGLFANPVVRLEPTIPDAGEPPDEDSIRYVPGAVIQGSYGWKVFIEQPAVPGPQMYQHLYQIRSALGLETPNIAMGLPSTSRATGRQEDIYAEQYTKQYRTLRNNLAKATAQTLSMALKILDTVPGLLPITVRATTLKDGKEIREEETVTKNDIDGYYECRVEFRAEDEITEDRLINMGRLLVGEGRIDWRTFLIDYCGYSQEKADEVINQTIADKAIFSEPLMGIIVQEAMEKAGMEHYLQAMQQQTQMQAGQGQSTGGQGMLQGQPVIQGGTQGQQIQRPSEAQNPIARDIIRQVLEQTPVGIRRSPTQGV